MKTALFLLSLSLLVILPGCSQSHAAPQVRSDDTAAFAADLAEGAQD